MTATIATETLRTLHRIHRQLEDLTGRLAAGPRQVAACASLAEAAEAALTAAQDTLKQTRKAADQKQLQLKSAEVRIADLEGKRNACKTNREYQTLGEQIDADRMATKVLEDEILEVLDRIDTLKPAIPEAEAGLAAARRRVADVQAQVDAEAAVLRAETDRVRGELTVVERDLAADVLEVYQRVVRSKGADGLAPVEGQTCGGCFQQITGNMLAEIMLGRTAICRGCGRLLYMPETSRPA